MVKRGSAELSVSSQGIDLDVDTDYQFAISRVAKNNFKKLW